MNVNQCDVSFEGTSSYEHPSFDVIPRVSGEPGRQARCLRIDEKAREGETLREKVVSLMDNGDLIIKYVDSMIEPIK